MSGGGSKMRAARLSAQQFEVLIQFMHQHPYFAVGRAAGGSCSKEEHDILWRTLTDALNCTEGPVKSVTKWQKCWVDLKSNARSRAKARAVFVEHSQGKTSQLGPVFTSWDEQVLKLLNDIADNTLTSIVAQSPLQLLEVGFSDKMNPVVTNGDHASRSTKSKFRSILPKSNNQYENGYHTDENGMEMIESVSCNSFNGSGEVHQAEDDMEEFIAEVKSEVEKEWSENNAECDDDYSVDSLPIRNGSKSEPATCLPTHGNSFNISGEDCCGQPGHERNKKRKQDDSQTSSKLEDSLERLSKKLCGTLDRMAAATEEANAIQMGMVNAMNRLASSFEQFLPVVSKVFSNNANLAGPS